MTDLKRLDVKVPKGKRKEPLWRGPQEDGVTFSLLSRFLVCRERFRLHVVEGLRPRDGFNHRLEFGSMWHVCEEALANTSVPVMPSYDYDADPGIASPWDLPLTGYVNRLLVQYPLARDEIDHWHQMCRAEFPHYVQHWHDHPDVKERTPLLQEQVFDVPYRLPSGRDVRLRGKFDSVDLIGSGKTAGVYLQENKTKSQIDARKIAQQLRFDLQTMMYLSALKDLREKYGSTTTEHFEGAPIRGVRYNVVRRPAHKTVESAMDKLTRDTKAGRVGEWFARWKVEISAEDVAKFRRQCLNPMLEQLCDWWEHVTFYKDDVFGSDTGLHFRFPYGVYSPMLEGASSDLDEYLETGSRVGLQVVDELFPELKGE